MVKYKFVLLLFFPFLSCFEPACGQAVEARLQQADSLFEENEFTEAYAIYQSLVETDRVSSAAMLMKMAYIQEGLGDYSKALYYLNQFFLLTNEEEVLDKMKGLASAHNLRGYEYDDFDLLQNFFRQYRYLTIFVLLGVAIIGLFFLAWRRKRYEHPPLGIGAFYAILLALLFVMVNYTNADRMGIITADNVYIMSGPSAGSKVISISGKGHRVAVADHEDVWLQIEWEGQLAYIRQGNVQIINP